MCKNLFDVNFPRDMMHMFSGRVCRRRADGRRGKVREQHEGGGPEPQRDRVRVLRTPLHAARRARQDARQDAAHRRHTQDRKQDLPREYNTERLLYIIV